MKSFFKLFALVSLMVISRLDKQAWQINGKPIKSSLSAGLPKNVNNLSKANNAYIQQLLLSQK